MFDVTDRVVALLGIPQQLTAEAALSASVTLAAGAVWQAQATATAVGDLAVAASADRTAPGAAALAADTTATGTAVRVQPAAASGSADLAASGTAVRVQPGEAALTADVTVVAAGGFVSQGDAAVSFDAALASEAVRVVFGQSSMSGSASSLTGTGSPVIRLITATAKRAITDDWLLKRYPIDVGLSLIVNGATVTEVEVPSQTELAEADYYFMGGRRHQITTAQRDVLVAAGFGSYIEEA